MQSARRHFLQSGLIAIVFACALHATPCAAQTANYDVVIYGGTSSGIAAAVQAAQMGKTVALVEPTSRIGGMTTNGLGATDIGNSASVQGLARGFYIDVGRADGSANNAPLFNFEPSVALNVYNTWLQNTPGITLYTGQQLDLNGGVTKQGTTIQSIRMQSGLTLSGKAFVDAGYEGDLMAGAGVSYNVGRESNATYGETYNGVQTARAVSHQFSTAHPVSAYVVAGDSSSGLLPGVSPTAPGPDGSADTRVQSYNYRVTVTQAANRLAWTAPAGYDPSNYELLRRQIVNNSITNITSLMNVVPVHGGKFDINNNGPVSTDFIGQNYAYPNANYTTRAQMAQATCNWDQGFFYYLSHDAPVQSLKDQMNTYGLAPDEFTDNNGWSDQLYVREARRMVGQYVMTDQNVSGARTVSDSIGLGSYTLDSHNAIRYVDGSGNVRNEGDVQITTPAPYGISYQSLTPKASEATNLVVTAAMSASHAGYGSLRLEPAYMIMGQAGGAAAALAASGQGNVQGLSYHDLRRALVEGGALLEYPANLATQYTSKIDFNNPTAGATAFRYSTAGTGYTGLWDGTGTHNLITGDLTYTRGGYAAPQAASVPEKLQGNYNAFRQSFRTLNAPMNGDIWLSFLVNDPTATSVGGISLNATYNGDPTQSTGNVGHSILLKGTALQFYLGSGTSQSLIGTGSTPLALGQTHLILAHLLAGSGNDALSIWADSADLKNLGTPDLQIDNQDLLSSLTSVALPSFDTSNNANGAFLDAVRIGNDSDAYAQVTGVPEPSAMMWLGLSASTFLLVRRRRCARAA